jgi:hypothetical protein
MKSEALGHTTLPASQVVTVTDDFVAVSKPACMPVHTVRTRVSEQPASTRIHACARLGPPPGVHAASHSACPCRLAHDGLACGRAVGRAQQQPAYRRHALPPRSTVVSGRPWCGNPLNLRNPWAKTQKSWATVGTPRDLAFSNINQIAQRERRWILLVETHAYMCSTRDLEDARLRKLGITDQPWLIKTKNSATVGY